MNFDNKSDAKTEDEKGINYYPINEESARAANNANSLYDYKTGSSTEEYRQYVDKAKELAERQKALVDPMYYEKIDHLFDSYSRKLAENMNKGFAIEMRVPSILIAGGSNFPVRKKEKQNAARNKNIEEWRSIQGLLSKIRSTGMGGISSDDPNAISKLEIELAELEKSQETMKAVNAYFRKNKSLDGCTLMSPEELEELKADMASSWHLGSKPFKSFSLSNNNAKIRRIKARIEELKHKREKVFEGWRFEGGRVESNVQENRLQVFFDEKPDVEKRSELKRNGFKWSPKAGAWQRQLSNNAIYSAKKLIKCIQPLSEEGRGEKI